MKDVQGSRVKERVWRAIDKLLSVDLTTGWNMNQHGHMLNRPASMSYYKNICVNMLLQDVDNPPQYFMDIEPKDNWPIDITVASENDNGMFVIHAKTVTTKEARMLGARRFSKYMATMRVTAMFEGKFGHSMTCLMAFIGGRWVSATDAPNSDDLHNNMVVCLASALRHRYIWSVAIGYDNTPSIRLETDPTGIREIFKNRDAGETGRREKLKGWINNHWRLIRTDPDIETYVRDHFRGTTKFQWGRMNCVIHPSAYDLDKEQQFIAERAVMTGTPRKRA